MKSTKKDLIFDILSQNKKGMHVDDIAEELIRLENFEVSKEILAKQVSSILSSDIRKKKTKSRFSIIKNKHGGHKRGWYKAKLGKKTAKEKTIINIQKGSKNEIPNISTLYTGKAGEHAVLSELLFNEFNASLMSVDEGIDIVASKEKKFFYIQVKTANNRRGSFYASILNSQFFRFINDNPFYIFVLRYFHNDKVRSGFIILRSSDLERFIETGIVKKK